MLSCTIQGGGERIILPTEFTLGGRAVPAMRWDDRYQHLGVMVGPNPAAALGELAEDFKEATVKIFQSLLADWMKLKAYRSFVHPKLDYPLRSTLATRKWAGDLDAFVRRTIKASLGLPKRTCVAVFYTPTAQGGQALRSVEDEVGNAMVTQAIKMLTSPDALIREVARHSLDTTVSKRYGEVEGPEDRWRLLGLVAKIK